MYEKNGGGGSSLCLGSHWGFLGVETTVRDQRYVHTPAHQQRNMITVISGECYPRVWLYGSMIAKTTRLLGMLHQRIWFLMFYTIA